MFIVPTGTLKNWLIERGMHAEADQGLVLNDDQVAHLGELREQAKGLKHYGPEEQEAWAVFTAYTHAGHKPAGMASSPDEMAPTLDVTRQSIVRIAKAAHGVASAIQGLPDQFGELGELADAMTDAKVHMRAAADDMGAMARELDVTLARMAAMAGAADQTLVGVRVVLDGTVAASHALGDIAAKFPAGPVFVAPKLPEAAWWASPSADWVRWLLLLVALVAAVRMR